MCLAVPGRITSISGEDPLLRTGKIDFGGILKEASLAYVPEAQIGDYVIVHVGFAISRLDEAEANKVFEYLREMEDLSELEEPAPGQTREDAVGALRLKKDRTETKSVR
jgi:hydrogenase expression/formation protein HypC